MKLTPFDPVLAPLIESPRKTTTSVALALTLIPLAESVAKIPANIPPASIVIDLVIVTAPYAPGSNALIVPPAAVFEIAPAKVLHGAVREQGLASSPTPETHVRVAWALAFMATTKRKKKASANLGNMSLNMDLSLIVPDFWS
jgi:hypothetical protein